MANRFVAKRKDSSALKDILLPILVFLVVGTIFYIALENVNASSEAERLRSMEKAISKATVQCYAVEGSYPPNLAYLEENYGLSVDTEKYIVQYDAFASNIMPTILVLPREFEQTDVPGGFAE